VLRSIRRRVLVSRLRSVLFIFLTLTFAAYSGTTVGAQVGGSLTGTIKDPSGGVVPGATVTVANSVLGTTFTATTDGQGLYSFPKLPVGRYDVTVQLDGFQTQKRTGIAVDADGAVQINVTLEIGGQSETVTVSVNAIRVDAVSTQLGEVVPSTTMTTLSLNGRSYTDLLAIQPGVIPMTTIQSNSVIMAGVTGPVSPSGGLNLSWICSFNIPIITICAFFVLNIFLSLLNIVFFWLPFVKICIPIPSAAVSKVGGES